MLCGHAWDAQFGEICNVNICRWGAHGIGSEGVKHGLHVFFIIEWNKSVELIL
jgi:hypothetical protein